MSTIQASTTISQPVERVFEFIWNPQNQRLWQPETIENLPLASEPGQAIGKSRTKVRGWAGLTMEVVEETKEFEVNRRVTAKTSEVHGWITSQNQWDFEPAAGGTQVSVRHEVELHGWLRLLGPLFLPAAQRKVENDLRRLKKILE